uniref:Transthyretin-like family protein n=1 Tax=Angiostrongylus cantonensis TaxID=6313 RepID=A0A0K0D5B3_ANGCA
EFRETIKEKQEYGLWQNEVGRCLDSILPGVVDTDDLMASGKTDSNGDYNLSGSTKEISGIEPYIAIYHDCNDGIKPCQRTFRVGIPSKYVTVGSKPKLTYDAGQLELAGKYPKEGRRMRCFLVLVTLGYVAALEMLGRDQSASVKGQLMCDGRPAVGVKVKLWDVDRTDIDDLMDEKYTDTNGQFFLSGWTKEYTTIDPKLSIYHDCNDGIKVRREITRHFQFSSFPSNNSLLPSHLRS